MLTNKLQEFYNMSDTELANYFRDLLSYDDKKALEERQKCTIVICERFVDKFADAFPSFNEDCEENEEDE